MGGMEGVTAMKGAARALLLLLLGGIFLLSGGLKAYDPGRFLYDVQAFHLLPYGLSFATALWLPWVEIFCGLAIWTGRGRRGALFLAVAMTIVFIAALLLARWRGVNLQCGCFGQWLIFPNLIFHLCFNTGLVAGAVALLVREARPTTAQPMIEPGRS